ncbi:HNH endonuclease [Bradyrhizobium sp. Tv2a-2]|uniref:HNH endonuclease n=1 Tax=Bradyrhizobium sp. Tv2a-2 TaxID=113395 RepID=UPI000A052DA3|nr:HNH endonuclease [Bradyrhizobium sp. Tv2a-2]
MTRSIKEWIGKTHDSQVPPRVRLRIFERHNGICHISGRTIRAGETWDLDHVVSLINGGEHRESNLAPALKAPHRLKTAQDVAEKSRVYRKRAAHLGIKPKKGRPMPGSRASGIRKRMNGTVERRT